eukprot:gene10949-biopygen6326
MTHATARSEDDEDEADEDEDEDDDEHEDEDDDEDEGDDNLQPATHIRGQLTTVISACAAASVFLRRAAAGGGGRGLWEKRLRTRPFLQNSIASDASVRDASAAVSPCSGAAPYWHLGLHGGRQATDFQNDMQGRGRVRFFKFYRAGRVRDASAAVSPSLADYVLEKDPASCLTTPTVSAPQRAIARTRGTDFLLCLCVWGGGAKVGGTRCGAEPSHTKETTSSLLRDLRSDRRLRRQPHQLVIVLLLLLG